jgi:diaminopimelate decarboxylase
MNDAIRSVLNRLGRDSATPCYVYFLDLVLDRVAQLERAFSRRFAISYAIKSNPNLSLLKRLRGRVPLLDASSAGELARALQAGYRASDLTFSGPGKRPFELERAVAAGPVHVVCESAWELGCLDALAGAAGQRMPVLLRINPRNVPRKFGVNMAGKPSPFGIDEEDLDGVLARLGHWRHLDFRGFHIYSGTNCLSEEAIAENFGIFIDLFMRFSEAHALTPAKLVFGAGFGIPYHDDQGQLNLDRLAALLNPLLDKMRQQPRLADALCILELGRYLVGPAGYFLTSVINEKRSRGAEVRICDGGMNNHLAACGLMGMIIRRNWPMWKVNAKSEDAMREYLLTGPLCTTIDTLGQQVKLHELHRGDLVAIGSSGAYGLTSSPTRFISHPEPREFLVIDAGPDVEVLDVTESQTGVPGELATLVP